jgi:hypothetical protein
MIDLYCERLNAGFLAEPVNAASNIAFFIAAFYAWQYSKQQAVDAIPFRLLIALMVSIGLGSLAFHLFANKASQLADLIPVFLFQLLYLWLYSKNVLACKRPVRVLLSILLLIGIAVSSQYPGALNGSLIYMPTLLVLCLISFYHMQQSTRGSQLVAGALVLFCLSLLFRTVDNSVCQYIAAGTHFLWHLLNGMVVFMLYRFLVMNSTSHKESPAA